MAAKKANDLYCWVTFITLAGSASYFGAVAALERGGWTLMISIFCGLSAIVLPLMTKIEQQQQ
jgi:hypothetical protein